MKFGDKVTILADPAGDFTKSVAKEIDLSGAGLGKRSTRYSMIVNNGIVESENVESKPNDLSVSDVDFTLNSCSRK